MRAPWWKVMLTEDDGNTVWSPLHIGFCLVLLNGIALADYAVVWLGQHFDAMAYGAGLGGLITGAGIAVYFNAKAPAVPGPKEG